MKKVITSVFVIMFLIISIHTKVSAFQDNQTVDANKTWTIKFTDEVGFDEETISGIIVTDSENNNVNVTIAKGNDNKTILVYAPQGGYTSGQNYKLDIGTNVHSSKNENMKKERVLHFSIKETTNNISSIKTYNTTVYKGKNYALPEKVIAVFEDGSTKELPVKWDHPYINGSGVGDFIYYGTVDNCDKKAQINITVKVPENINDLEDYLNIYYNSIDSPLGKLIFKHTVEENQFDFFPYDIRIKTEYDGFYPFDLEHSIKISDEDKQETIELLREYQKKMASDILGYFPDKKIEGCFFKDGYSYPYIHEGYWQTTFLTWINYDYDVLNASDYKSTHITNFQWFNLYDDYNFTGEPKRTR